MTPQPAAWRSRTVGIIGYGAIGRVLSDELEAGRDGLTFGGVVGRQAPSAIRCDSVEQLIDRCDVVVEAAGQQAVEQYGRQVLCANRDLLVLSVGAFAEDRLLRELESVGRGQLIISTGAIGGIDLLKAAALSGRLEEVSITTTKPLATLIKAGDSDPGHPLDEHGGAVTVFEGSAREVASRYPASTNVAATVGLCTLGMDRVQVRLIADPNADLVSHRLQASGHIGTYDFSIINHPSENPRTSLVTPYAALRALLDTQARVVIG